MNERYQTANDRGHEAKRIGTEHSGNISGGGESPGQTLQQTLTKSGNDQPEGFEEDMDAEISPSSEPRPCPHCQKGTLVCIGRLPRRGRAPP